MASLIHELREDAPGVILDDCVTAEAAAELTGYYNLQHICRLAFSGEPETYRIGRSWLI